MLALKHPSTKQGRRKKKKTTYQTHDDVEQDNDGSTDPHNIYNRFVMNQKHEFSIAYTEICEGYKRSCWLWFIFPTAPYIVDGIERGSSMNKYYALRGDASVKAYLQWNNHDEKGDDKDVIDDEESGVIDLRRNYIRITKAVEDQLMRGNTMDNLFGPLDSVKAISSLKLFSRVGSDMKDFELSDACDSVLRLAAMSSPNKKKGKQKSNLRRSVSL